MDKRVAAASIILLNHLAAKKKNRKPRSKWMRALFLTRELNTALLHRMDLNHFANFTRMSPGDFEEILNLISPLIVKKGTNFREPISPKLRLQITLRFLATGDSYVSLQYLFKVSKQSISLIVPETCAAIIQVLNGYIKLPTSPDEWLKVAQEFERRWNYPLCIGAMDGKHCVITKPFLSGSEFINYEGDFSVVLFALVDADCNFMFVDVGCQGRISDGGVFKDTVLYRKLERNELGQPANQFVEEMGRIMPYVIVADEAFSLTENTMKPYSGTHPKGSLKRIFNHRLSRARRVTENAFGISSSVFRVLRKPMLLEADIAQLVITAVTLLHNYLRRNKVSRLIYATPDYFDQEDAEGNVIPGKWRKDAETSTSFLPLVRMPRRSTASAKEVRNTFANYFYRNRLAYELKS